MLLPTGKKPVPLLSLTIVVFLVSFSNADCRGYTYGEWINEATRSERIHLQDWLDVSLGITSVYQRNMRGGLSTNNRRSGFAGSYDLELIANMHRLLGSEGASLYIHAEGWSSKTQGIDPVSVGSVFGVNDDAISPRAAIVITELRYGQELLDGTFIFQIGKMTFLCRAVSIIEAVRCPSTRINMRTTRRPSSSTVQW